MVHRVPGFQSSYGYSDRFLGVSVLNLGHSCDTRFAGPNVKIM